MWNNILLVGLGGGIGSILRYLCQRSLNWQFPFGTVVVNIIGCFLIGLLWGLSLKTWDESKKLFLMTGLCGGFTTFSAFSHESLQMMMEHKWFMFFLYAGTSILGGMIATFIGFKITTS